MNNYIVTFEYRVMVTAFAILAMFREQKESRILGEFPSFVIFHVFVKVTKTVMMTPTLISIMSDVRSDLFRFDSISSTIIVPHIGSL